MKYYICPKCGRIFEEAESWEEEWERIKEMKFKIGDEEVKAEELKPFFEQAYKFSEKIEEFEKAYFEVPLCPICKVPLRKFKWTEDEGK